MGKTADNEKHKANAAFYNNIAAAFVITGFIVPYVALLNKSNALGAKIESFDDLLSIFTMDNFFSIIVIATTAFMAFTLAMLFRRIADQHLEKLID